MTEQGYDKWLENQKVVAEKSRQRRVKNIERYELNPKTCKVCNAAIHYDKRLKSQFCSRSCGAKYNNTQRGGELRPTFSVCEQCGKTKEMPDRKTTRFCSQKCWVENKKNTVILKWERNEFDGATAKGSLSKTLRDYLIEKYDYKCQKCSWNTPHPKTGIPPLQVNHIDGNPSNNFISNLEVICPNCHALTNNWGGYNRGNGRKSRGLSR